MLSFSLLICVVRSLGEQTMAIKRFNGKNMVNNNLVIVSFFCSESFLFPMCLFLFSKNLMPYDHWSCCHFCPYEKTQEDKDKDKREERRRRPWCSFFFLQNRLGTISYLWFAVNLFLSLAVLDGDAIDGVD